MCVGIGTIDDLRAELFHDAHRFDLDWYDCIVDNGCDRVFQCNMSSSGSLRDSWKSLGDFVRLTRVDLRMSCMLCHFQRAYGNGYDKVLNGYVSIQWMSKKVN